MTSPKDGPWVSALSHASSGAIGTAIATALLYPLDVISTRLKVQNQVVEDDREDKISHDQTVVGSIRAIASNEGGPQALYAGLTQDVCKSVADSFLFFLFYTYLRAARRSRKRHSLSDWEELVAGAIAGACARGLTLPIANVVVRKQTAALLGSGSENSETETKRIVQDIYNEKGIRGFWAGYSASLVLTINPSITFFLQQKLNTKLVEAHGGKEDGLTTFFLAAGSKAVATAITYPFQTAKARLQAQSYSTSQSISDDARQIEEQNNTRKGQESQAPQKSAPRKPDPRDKSTIFGVVSGIARSEGISGVYGGIHVELIKNFFSHGLTMTMKGFIHKFVVYMFLVIASRMRRRGQGFDHPRKGR